MIILNKSIIAGLIAVTIAFSIYPAMAGKKGKASNRDITFTQTLDFNEETHLSFMCQEEKLARDVYITLGTQYPQSIVFGNIDNSEQRHMDSATDVLLKYGFPNPSTNDNVGVFTSEDYGWYFSEKYNQLTTSGANSELDAFYVGALIEELDMRDINFCPTVIVETDNGINNISECGKVYTDKEDIIRLYDNLLEGSTNHLKAYVENIEKMIGEGNYEAQVLTQEQVDEILGR